MSGITIFIPKPDDSQLSNALRLITADIDKSRGEFGGYGFGGEHGYGAKWSSDVFAMHPYCWCEESECPWCEGCRCVDDTKTCPWCVGELRYADKGALGRNTPPHSGAPNFWHKSSGFRVWWYKYIGRGMELHGDGDFAKIVDDCLVDIAKATGK